MAIEGKSTQARFSVKEVEYLKRGLDVLVASISRAYNSEKDVVIKAARATQLEELKALQARLFTKDILE